MADLTTRAFATAACALALLGGAGARAAPPEAEVRARTEVYADDDATTVWRPRVGGQVTEAERYRVGASWMADVVSSASIDVASRASVRIHETRHELGAQGAWLGPEAAELSLGYTYGFEPDYASHGASLGAARDLGAERLWHLTGGLSASHARIGTVADPRFERHANTVGLTGRASRVLDARTVGRLGLELAGTFGFQASPYRAVRLGNWTAMRYDGDDPDAGAWVFTGVTGVVRERHPERRLRARLVLDGVRAMAERWALYALVAGYVDDWGIVAGEVSAEARWRIAEPWLLRVGARVYLQDGAWFWRARYVDGQEEDGYVTDDKELGPVRSYSAMANVTGTFTYWTVLGGVELVRYRYPDFDLLPRKNAVVVQLGVGYRP